MQREKHKWSQPQGESTDVEHWGGTIRTSVDGTGAKGSCQVLHLTCNWKQDETMDATKTKPFNIDKKLVYNAYKAVNANAGAAGVDGQSLEMFDKDPMRNLYKIWNRMSLGSYFPPPVRAVPIPKKSGGQRILGCPQWQVVWRRWWSRKSCRGIDRSKVQKSQYGRGTTL
jgi:hypothetical protein